MYLWTIDARESIKDLSEIDTNLIEETEDIKDFLKGRHYFVVATKGLGKSLLLLFKRKGLKGLDCTIPKDILLDVPDVTIEHLSQEVLTLLYQEDTLKLLWSISIISAIFKNLNKVNELNNLEISTSLKSILDNPYCTTVSSVFGVILNEIGRKQFYQDLANDYNKFLITAARTLNKSIAIFIDNVDECFEKADRDIWYATQNGLIKAIYHLVRINPKFKIFASIRKEAFLKLKTEMSQQYDDVSLDLSYSKDDLMQIFIKNIKKEAQDKLADMSNTNPIDAFIGLGKIHHGHVNEDEDIFDYIYRHTLKRPRDFMEIGKAISRCKVSERNPKDTTGINKIKVLINEAAAKIANEYIQEMLPHLTINENNLNNVYELIDSNILNKEKAKNICMKFNGNDAKCLETDCKTCTDGIHIFCELYKIGLLGYVDMAPIKKGEYTQKFVMVGEKIFDDVTLLPDSSHYLIHPILDERIRQENNLYKHQINTVNIVGYERRWKTTTAVPTESIQRPTIFISSTNDLTPYKDAVDEIITKKNFTSIRSETFNKPNSLEDCQKLARECHYFVITLGPRYGEEVEGKSICEHEFTEAYKDNPEKIIVYVLEGDIKNWDRKQQNLVNRIQGIKDLGYARGARINLTTIKDRFEKDLVERIARLSRQSSTRVRQS